MTTSTTENITPKEETVSTVPAETTAETTTGSVQKKEAVVQKAAPPTVRARRPRERRGRGERRHTEFDQATIDVRRVARVMAGGRRFSFSATIVIGDRKGRVGIGLGKGADTALAIEKAARSARRKLITVQRTESGSIPYAATIKYSSSVITIIPSPGRGIVAGSAMRTVLEFAGVSDVVGKIISRSKNKLTIARATTAALASLAAPISGQNAKS